jgi:ADP-dependent NAD(P)H-hydrate dehydratase / NAD(P)H-hydrate epimerase
MRVVTVDEMRTIEQRAAAEYGLSSPILMEHAGRSVAEHLRDALGGSVAGHEVLVLVGPGNNGGDGRVMARHLAEWGAHVATYAWKDRRIEADSRFIPVGDDLAAVHEIVRRADVVAVALLGTGHSRPLDPSMVRLLDLVRDERAHRPGLFVLAVDLPSGLYADSGAVDDGTLAADLTVTLAFPKLGLFLFPGADYVGRLEVGGIGLPADMAISTTYELLDAGLVGPLLPARPLDSNKGTFGKVLAVAGSAHFIGAAYLVAASAARIGAGLVTLATAADHAPLYAMKLPEATYHLLPPEEAAPEQRAQSILDALGGYRAAIVGPGLGQSDATRAFLDHLFAGLRALPDEQRPHLIVDADGLNNLAQMDRWHERLPPRTVITPHPGEMSRLLGGEHVSGGGPDRLEIVRRTADEWGLVVVLKGACTLIAASGAPTRINWPPNPALATAGSGDVLSGVVGGLLAQGLEPYDAASAAVYLHSRAGLLVSQRLGDAGTLAGDLIPELPLALRETKSTPTLMPS